MASTARPSTPVTPRLSTPQTGTWKHPRFDEIARRQNATTFTDRNVKMILFNVGGLLAMWMSEKFVKANIPSLFHATAPLRPYSTYLYILMRFLLVYNIIVAVLPLARRKDDLSDIPLTPAQRKLLGLPPSSTPPTPGSQYVTPPRYARSPTPHSGSPSSGYSNSPLSGKGSGGKDTPKGSPFSQNASPLLHKAIGGGMNGPRRSSYGTPSPLGPGGPKASWADGSATPSPSTGKAASVSLNNKWLYEKGRTSSGSSRVFS